MCSTCQPYGSALLSQVASVLQSLGSVLKGLGRKEEAEETLAESVDVKRRANQNRGKGRFSVPARA